MQMLEWACISTAHIYSSPDWLASWVAEHPRVGLYLEPGGLFAGTGRDDQELLLPSQTLDASET